MHRGGHYLPGAPQRVDVGAGVVVQGRVLGARDCIPVPGAKIDHWQADSQGGYRFETEWPGAPIPHLHFIVTARGYQTLVTQWVGDEPVARIRLDFVLRPKQ
jgi:protocatechuate 3,4-dioxygenase beta subunit